MEAQPRRAYLCGYALETVVNCPIRQVTARVVGKYHAGALPVPGQLEALLCLPYPLRPEYLHDIWSWCYRSRLSVLWRRYVILPALLLFTPQLALYRDCPFVEVHAVPREAEQFALPQSGEQRSLEQQFMLMSIDGFKKRLYLLVVEWRYFGLLHSRECTGVGGIKADITDSYGLLQRLMKNPMNILYRLRRQARLIASRLTELVV